jgi:hypothetical protein
MDVEWMLHGCCMGAEWMLHAVQAAKAAEEEAEAARLTAAAEEAAAIVELERQAAEAAAAELARAAAEVAREEAERNADRLAEQEAEQAREDAARAADEDEAGDGTCDVIVFSLRMLRFHPVARSVLNWPAAARCGVRFLHAATHSVGLPRHCPPAAPSCLRLPRYKLQA